MRQQGTITTWKDQQGFGFIAPDGGGAQVFVHIKAFANCQRRPVGNEIVTYETAFDERGRIRAEQVAFAGESHAVPSGSGIGWLAFPVLFLSFVTASVFMERLPVAILGIYLVASAVAFLVYALDKSAAKRGQWRTSESTLHLLSLTGGWPGALVAQKVLRHKSRKPSFQIEFWTTLVLNCMGFAWLLLTPKAEALRTFLGAP